MVVCLVTHLHSSSRADDDKELPEGCFDFDKAIDHPLRIPIPHKKKGDNSAFGENKETKVVWGAARGYVKKSIKEVYKTFLDHRLFKDMSKTTLDTEEFPKKHYQDWHHVVVKVRVFAFVKVSWEEGWGYRLLQGTAKDPKKYLILYQKQAGTSHLEHLCGNFILSKKDKNTTDVYLYEQLKSKYRSGEDTAKMHLHTLKKLRGLVPLDD